MECLACSRPIARFGDVCRICKVSYTRAWAVGGHRDALRELIGRYKFHSMRAAGVAMADLLDQTLPLIPSDVIITSVPTVRSHIRERGFDHAVVLAKALAKKRNLPYRPTLIRLHGLTQRGSGRRDRIKQASKAFAPIKPLQGGTYLLVDDVCTTGATVHFAAKALRDAGAEDVWVAVISKEPLD